MSEITSGRRPKHLNLLAIKLPLPGVVSILHRASGLYLIWALPFLTWALSAALEGPSGYEAVASVMNNIFIKILLLGTIWSVMHHLCAGIRFLFIEILVGIDLKTTRAVSMLVMVTSVFLTLAVGGSLLL